MQISSDSSIQCNLFPGLLQPLLWAGGRMDSIVWLQKKLRPLRLLDQPGP